MKQSQTGQITEDHKRAWCAAHPRIRRELLPAGYWDRLAGEARWAEFNEGRKTMKTYRIENTTSGCVLGTYAGETEDEAWTACAADAGDSDAVRGEDVAVTEVTELTEVAALEEIVATATAADAEFGAALKAELALIEAVVTETRCTEEALIRAAEIDPACGEYLARSRESGVPVLLVETGTRRVLVLEGQESPEEGTEVGLRAAVVLGERS